jgi:hypothetical protein
MKNRILKRMLKMASEEVKVTFSFNLIHDGGEIRKSEVYSLEEYCTDYDVYDADELSDLIEKFSETPEVDVDKGILIFTETSKEKVLEELKSIDDFSLNVMYNEDILDVFSMGDENLEIDDPEYEGILKGEVDYTAKTDISVYGEIIPNSIKFL